MSIICKIFGHDYAKRWAGAKRGHFGVIMVNVKTCNRCQHSEYEHTTGFKVTMPEEDIP